MSYTTQLCVFWLMTCNTYCLTPDLRDANSFVWSRETHHVCVELMNYNTHVMVVHFMKCNTLVCSNPWITLHLCVWCLLVICNTHCSNHKVHSTNSFVLGHAIQLTLVGFMNYKMIMYQFLFNLWSTKHMPVRFDPRTAQCIVYTVNDTTHLHLLLKPRHATHVCQIRDLHITCSCVRFTLDLYPNIDIIWHVPSPTYLQHLYSPYAPPSIAQHRFVGLLGDRFLLPCFFWFWKI